MTTAVLESNERSCTSGGGRVRAIPRTRRCCETYIQSAIVKVDVRKKSITSSTDVTPNRKKSPSLRRDIPEVCGLTQVISPPARDKVPARRPRPWKDSRIFLRY